MNLYASWEVLSRMLLNKFLHESLSLSLDETLKTLLDETFHYFSMQRFYWPKFLYHFHCLKQILSLMKIFSLVYWEFSLKRNHMGLILLLLLLQKTFLMKLMTILLGFLHSFLHLFNSLSFPRISSFLDFSWKSQILLDLRIGPGF